VFADFKVTSFPKPCVKFVTPEARIAKIECHDSGDSIRNLRLCYSNGVQSPLMGDKDHVPNTTVDVPADRVVSKLKVCFHKYFEQNQSYVCEWQMVRFELRDEDNGIIVSCGENKGGYRYWCSVNICDY